MQIALIFASDNQGIIGRDNALPWRQKSDLLRFKKLTLGFPMLMGRLTFESLPGILPGRPHLVLSRNKKEYENASELIIPIQSFDKAIDWCLSKGYDKLFVIGGAQLFDLTVSKANIIYHTRILANVEGDVSWKIPKNWICTDSESHQSDTENQYPYCFEIYTQYEQ